MSIIIDVFIGLFLIGIGVIPLYVIPEIKESGKKRKYRGLIISITSVAVLGTICKGCLDYSSDKKSEAMQSKIDTMTVKIDTLQGKVDSIQPTIGHLNSTITVLSRSVERLSADSAGFALFLQRLEKDYHIKDSSNKPIVIEKIVSSTEYRPISPGLETKVLQNLKLLQSKFQNAPTIYIQKRGQGMVIDNVLKKLQSMLTRAEIKFAPFDPGSQMSPSSEEPVEIVVSAKDTTFVRKFLDAIKPFINITPAIIQKPDNYNAFILRFQGSPLFDQNGTVKLH
jgi:hypothetical protein